MEQKFKEALRNLYKFKLSKAPNTEYKDHLFPLGWSYRTSSPIAKFEKPKALKPETEKAKVIDSLKDFSESLIENTQSNSIKLDNIEIRKKEQNEFNNADVLTREYIIQKTSEASFKARYTFEAINKLESTIDVIFVADTLRDNLKDNIDDLSEFEALFDEQTALLFSKMVKAMKVPKQNYLLTAISMENGQDKSDILDSVLAEVSHFKPKLVITLGVSASHALIDTKQRLKDLHGKFFPVKIGDFSGEVMPLFSPSLLNSAPHMKSITWTDMQKAMEKLS